MLAKIHFLTFGAGDTWPEAARRLGDQARSTAMFSSVSVEIGDESFSRWPEFKQHREFVEKNPRGWGYWLWKPFLIRSYFRSLKEGDILLYLDDTPSQTPQKTHYFENRHDQSVFNLLLDAYRIEPAGQYLDYNCGAHEFEKWPALFEQPFLRLGNRKY